MKIERHTYKIRISIDSIIVKKGFFLVLHEFSQGFRTRAIYNGEWGLLWEKGVLPVMVYVRPGRGCAVMFCTSFSDQCCWWEKRAGRGQRCEKLNGRHNNSIEVGVL